jgi:adenine-specific DNA methylase
MRLIKNASNEKLRGGYYTPKGIALFLLKWGLNGKKDSDILEPSCGDGVFLQTIQQNNMVYNSISAIEIDKTEAKKAASISLQNLTVNAMDFHKYCNSTSKRFDLVVGNPPYIRYQYFDKKQQQDAKLIYEKVNLTYTKLSNAWVSFVVGASLLLREVGKIAFVLPAELLQVSYANELRKYLSSFFNKINIISFQQLVFQDIQQEVILLLCEKNRTDSHTIEHLDICDLDSLSKLDINQLKTQGKNIDFKQSTKQRKNPATLKSSGVFNNKWTYYFLKQKEIDFLKEIYNNALFATIGNYADVEVGITTGANGYFTVPWTTVTEYHLQKYAKPMVGRSVNVPSVRFTKDDWLHNRNSKVKSSLLVFPSGQKIINDSEAMRYITYGESQGINKGYKTGIRDDWFVIPSIRLSDALFIRRNNIYPKLILNDAGAYTTDTMHRVFVKDNTNKNALIASYYNSLSFAFAEIAGRSYGGGVLELMPSETESIFLPYNEANSDLIDMIDTMLRSKINIDKILEITNQNILYDRFGLSVNEIKMANTIWKKLCERRLNRAKSVTQ